MSTALPEAWDVADLFVAAVLAGNEPAAAGWCTADAWLSAGDSPARLYRDVVSRGLQLTADDVERSGDRAVAGVQVVHPARPDRPRMVQLLLLEGADGWQVDGLALGALHASAFLAGTVDARPTLVEADGAALAGLASPEGRVGRRLAMRLAQVAESGGSWSVARARALPGLGRAELLVVSTLPGEAPQEVWVYLDVASGFVLGEDAHPSWGSLFAALPEPETEEEHDPRMVVP